MGKIIIKKNPNGDTRTAPKTVTLEQFQTATDLHRDDVRRVLEYFGNLIKERGELHDFTKKTQEQQFYEDFTKALTDNSVDFTSGAWYKMHIAAERHHLQSNCPEDVNLLDVLEMLADCVCAGKARSGEIRDVNISSDILQKAVANTVNMLDKLIDVDFS